MGFPVRISITLDLILVTTREKVASWKIFLFIYSRFFGSQQHRRSFLR